MLYYNLKESGKRIAELRKEGGLTQEQFAEELNISVSYLGKIERGIQRPSIELFVEMAVKFNVSVDYILLGRNMPSDNIGRTVKQMEMLLNEIKTYI